MPRGLPKPGYYRHFKGGEYEIVGVISPVSLGLLEGEFFTLASHSETEDEVAVNRVADEGGFVYYIENSIDDELVLYRACYGEMGWWVRPTNMFIGDVDKPTYSGPRFQFLRGAG